MPAETLEARLEALLPGGRGVWLPIDHGFTDGVVPGIEALPARLPEFVTAGVDVIVAHKGLSRHTAPLHAAGGHWVMHLSGSTMHGGPARDSKRLVGSVAEAVRRGATGVSLHLTLGDPDEPRMLEDAGRITEHAHEAGLPVLAMVYPRGPNLQVAADDATHGVAHAARLAWELGCHVVKVPWTGDSASFATVVAGTPIPVLCAGGAAGAHGVSLLEWVEAAMSAGAAGVCIGRQVWGAADPLSVAGALRALVHGPRALVSGGV